MVDDIAVQEFVDAISTPPQNTITTYSGVVSRIDNQGVVWVRLAGANNETPTASTSAEVESGDEVTVEWRNNKLYIGGNYSNPSAGVIRVDAVQQAAQVANQAAANAVADAGVARTAAQQAQASAENASQSATTANQNAQRAYDAANASLVQLGMVEDVVGALNWISSHATYQKSNDTSIIQNKFYFTLNGTAVENPTGSPSNKGYYELVDNVYELSEDSEVDATKTYYTVVAVSATPTQSPSSEGLYEVRDLSEGVSQYIASHLALDESGLHVVNGSSRIDLSPSGGIDIWSNSKKIAHYGSDAQLGDTNGYHIDIQSGTNARLSFKNNDTEIAYMSKDMLYIPRAVVVDSMQVGDESEGGAWRWVIDPSSRSLTLSWIGGV